MTSKENAKELAIVGGACLASEWTTGSGRYIRKRPIPIWCKEYDRADVAKSTKGETKKQVERLLKNHPRARSFVVLDNRRALNAWCKSKGHCMNWKHQSTFDKICKCSDCSNEK